MLFLFFSCQKEETPVKEMANVDFNVQKQPTIKTIDDKQANPKFDILKDRFQLGKHFVDVNQTSGLSKTTTKNGDIIIHDDVVKEITLGNYISYTMRITFPKLKTTSLYNLTIEEYNGSTGMFVTKYTPRQGAVANLSTDISDMSITTQRITDIDYYNPEEDVVTENPVGNSNSGSSSETYPYDCDDYVVTTSVLNETLCGCGHTWEDLLQGICTGCQIREPMYPSLSSVNLYECIPYNYGDDESGTNDPTGGGGGSTTDTGTPSITTPIGLDGARVTENYIIVELNIVDANTIDWIYDGNNSQTVLDIYQFIFNNNTVEAKDFAKQAIEELVLINKNSYPGINDGLPFNWWNDDIQIEQILGDPYEDWKRLSQEEKRLTKSFPNVAYRIYKNKTIAFEKTFQLFGNTPQVLNGRPDAFRHAFFQAINTVKERKYFTKLFANAHESETPQRWLLEKQMDLFNNEIGMDLIEFDHPNWTDTNQIANEILNSLNNGKLKYLSPIDYTGADIPGSPFWDNAETTELDDGTHGITSSTNLIPTNQ